MEISVVICCFNSAKRIVPTLRALFAECRAEGGELIVVDNNCSDDTINIVNYECGNGGIDVVVVKEAKPGLMYARIAGVRAASSELVCFIDDDNIVDPGYLRAVKIILVKNSSVGYVGTKSRLPADYVVPDWFSAVQHSFAVGQQREVEGLIARDSPLLWGAGLCVRKSAFLSILDGGEGFKLLGRAGGVMFAGDDSEICLRLQICGWAGWYSAEASLTHAIDQRRLTSAALKSMYQGFGKSAAYLYVLQKSLDQSQSSIRILSREGGLFSWDSIFVIRAFLYFSYWRLKLFSNRVVCEAKIAYWRQAILFDSNVRKRGVFK